MHMPAALPRRGQDMDMDLDMHMGCSFPNGLPGDQCRCPVYTTVQYIRSTYPHVLHPKSTYGYLPSPIPHLQKYILHVNDP
jgi:hypothetical protein